MKTIKGDLILKEDTVFKESITVEGDIRGRGYFDLKVEGNIDCINIDCRNLDCYGNIDCRNIDCINIDCYGNINCWNIDCWNIIYCEKLTKKNKKAVIKAKVFIDKRSKLKQKEVQKK
jgi:hypothetical protein